MKKCFLDIFDDDCNEDIEQILEFERERAEYWQQKIKSEEYQENLAKVCEELVKSKEQFLKDNPHYNL